MKQEQDGQTKQLQALKKNKHTAEVNISAKLTLRQRNDSACDGKTKKQSGRVEAKKTRAQCEHITRCMMLQVKCGQKECLQKVQ